MNNDVKKLLPYLLNIKEWKKAPLHVAKSLHEALQEHKVPVTVGKHPYWGWFMLAEKSPKDIEVVYKEKPEGDLFFVRWREDFNDEEGWMTRSQVLELIERLRRSSGYNPYTNEAEDGEETIYTIVKGEDCLDEFQEMFRGFDA